jgi:hypothetical protein
LNDEVSGALLVGLLTALVTAAWLAEQVHQTGLFTDKSLPVL